MKCFKSKETKLLFFTSVILVLLLSFQSICLVVNSFSIERDYWPTDSWQTKTFEEADVNGSKIDFMMDYARYQNYNLDSALIVKDGYLIHEEYPRPSHYLKESVHNIFSITKSIISTLIGIAIEKGFITSIHQNILDFLYNSSITNIDLHENVTIYHLLTMTSGIDWIENEVSWTDPTNSHHNMYLSSNWVEFVLSQTQQYEPGTTFYYNSGGVHLLSAIIEKATGNSTLEFAQRYLFGPLGFSTIVWDQDPQGVYIGGSDCRLLPVDLTKFGYLFLNNGSWNGTQIISKEWVLNASKAISDTPWGSYGYLWWVHSEINSYFGMGNQGQLIGIIPDYDIIATFTATFLTGYHFPFYIDDLIKKYVIKAVQEGYWEPEYQTPATTETSIVILISLNTLLIILLIQKKRNEW